MSTDAERVRAALKGQTLRHKTVSNGDNGAIHATEGCEACEDVAAFDRLAAALAAATAALNAIARESVA